MASVWYGIGISSGIALMGWFISPMISFILNKILSYLYDASKKVPELVADTIPDLKNALREVEELWMLKKLSPDKSSGVFTVEKLESLVKSLKAALYEAEDIVDLIDYHLMDAKARGEPHDTTWLQWCWRCLCNPIRETSALALERAKQILLGRCRVHIVGERLAALWQCLQTIVRWLGRWMHRSGAHLPIYSVRPSSCNFENFLRSITNWFSEVYASAKDNRDWSNNNAGFRRYEQDVDCAIMGPLCTPLKENMKRIEKLFDEASKCTSFTRRVQESIEQPEQQRIKGSGNTPNFTNKDEHVTAYPAMKVTGREKVLEQIRARLRDVSSSENVIGICGIPGSGKTTLAQYVYQSEKGRGHFDVAMWIHVSQNFSVDVIFRRMFEEASPNEETACPTFSSLNALLTKLVNKLKGKRLLLVLDDIWSNEVLPQLVSPFKVGLIGSKILVTSRTESALEDLGPDVRHKILPIPPLDDKDFFELLMYYACVDTRDQCGSQLHAIGGEIAKQLKGSPLAARLVGGILREKRDVDFWRTIQDRELLNETTGADLWWCYRHLDEHIRRCFAFCSIFPRGLPLFRVDLVNLWVAEGFIRSTIKGKEMEDVGEEYFHKLLSTSFLQPGGMCQGRDYYLVHDLLHDLAKEVAGSDCISIENDIRQSGEEQIRSSWKEVPRDVRHLFVQNYNGELIIGKILELENLRTLVIYNVGWNVPVEDKVIKSIFQRLQKLRVLAIAFNFDNYGTNLISGPVSVPESVSQSKHLRYLAFRTDWKSKVTFPSTPTKLYHLWLLDVGRAKHVEFSGSDFTNLRHVISDEPTRFGDKPTRFKVPNMGKMSSLQKLPCFCVSKERGYEVIQLGDLNKLRGSLSVSGLENVRSKVEALEANLAMKERLRELKLEWNSSLLAQVTLEIEEKVLKGLCPPRGLETLFDLEIEEKVLEGLCPPIGLETLHIFAYRGLRYPNWMLDKQNGGPMYLKKLMFSRCRQQGPPPQIKAFIHLQSLELSNCSWDALPDNMADLTSLKVLHIERCLRIRSLPTLPQSIEEFTLSHCNAGFMWSCEGKEYFSCKQFKEHLNWQMIKHIPKKTFIYLEGYLLSSWGAIYDGL